MVFNFFRGELYRCSNNKFHLFQEPVQCEDDIVRFCEETGLPVALDETVDNIQGKIPDSLARFTHPGVTALVGSSKS